MKITYHNPGFSYSVDSILLFNNENASPFWMEPLLYFYPKLDREMLAQSNASQKRQYLTDILSPIYSKAEMEIEGKVSSYQAHFALHQKQIEDAFSQAFGLNSQLLFPDLQANITLNPICPRFLQERRFDVFYKSSPRGALGLSLHESIHYFWFYVWNKHFGDSYDEYEQPSLKWILSEMVVESIMADPRLSSINPYFPRENGGCIYPYFFNMIVDGQPILETLDRMYRQKPITDFMEQAYQYCLLHENTIRCHILESEKSI